MDWARKHLKLVKTDGDAELKRVRNYRSFPSKKYGRQVSYLGQGVSSKVYAYRPDAGGGVYAVKRFEKKNLGDPDEKKEIMREVRIHTQVNHSEYVVDLVDFFTVRHDADFFLILEYLPCTLLQLYSAYGSMLPQADRLCYFKQIVAGLHYLQSQNIGHRDIKLQNCGLDCRGNIKLIDFGAATVGNVGYGMAGSPLYAAPEIHSRLKYDSFTCDVWSLGVVLINLFYLSRPRWKSARHDDPGFSRYSTHPDLGSCVADTASNPGSAQFDAAKPSVDRLILLLLTIDPASRLPLHSLVAEDPWFREIGCCTVPPSSPGSPTTFQHHRHLEFLGRVTCSPPPS